MIGRIKISSSTHLAVSRVNDKRIETATSVCVEDFV